MTRIARLIATYLCGLLTLCATAHAQDWPAKPVRFVTPFAAGGGADFVANIIADNLGRQFKQRFVVENVAGGGGLAGAVAVARARPDGHTLLLSGISTHVIMPLVRRSYNPVTDFTNIAFIGGSPVIIAVHPSLEVRTLEQLVAVLRRRKEPWRFASSGRGTLGQMVGELWSEKDGFRLSFASYNNPGEAVKELIGGHAPLGAISSITAMQRRSELVLLAVTSAERLPDLKDVPTFRELGYPDLVATTWYGIAAPKGLSSATTARINEAIGTALDDATVKTRLVQAGLELDRKSPEQFSAFIRAEVSKWAPVLRPKQQPKKQIGPRGTPI